MLSEEKKNEIRERAAEIIKKSSYSKQMKHDRVLYELRVHQIELELQNEELQESQKEIEKQKKEFEDLFNFAPVGYFILNEEGIILDANLNGTKLLGVKRQNIQRKPFILYILPEDHKTFFDHLRFQNVTDGIDHVVIRIQTKDETIRWTRFETHDFSGRLLTAVMDITEEISLRNRIEKEKLAAESASKVKTVFLENMSHEIKTPLNEILSMAQLTDETNLTDQQKKYISSIQTAGKNLLSKIDNIIDFSNIDKHAAEKKNSAFTIDKIFTELESVFSDAVKKNKINTEFKIHFEDNRVFIGDSGKIKKILFHIIENAIKFTQEGSVSVKSRLKDSNEVLIFSVKDSGIGIDHETAVKMYEAFNQGDESYSKRYQGLGLGLSLAKAMTELLNGRIDFESEHGNGTEFTITIPIKTGKSEGCKEQVSSRIPKILVADDNAINVLYLKTMLEKQGFSVLEASNGNEAVSILKTTEVDLILMDISMPELDGPETLSIIRKNAEKKSTPYIPVIAITAFTLNGDRNKFIQMGFDEYIKKPFEKNDILSVIRSFLGETDEE